MAQSVFSCMHFTQYIQHLASTHGLRTFGCQHKVRAKIAYGVISVAEFGKQLLHLVLQIAALKLQWGCAWFDRQDAGPLLPEDFLHVADGLSIEELWLRILPPILQSDIAAWLSIGNLPVGMTKQTLELQSC